MVLSLSRILKWTTGGCEAILGIPIIGQAIIFSTNWGALIIMFILHLMTFLIARNEKGSVIGSGLGMLTSVAGVLPFLGLIMHMATAATLVIDAIRHKE